MNKFIYLLFILISILPACGFHLRGAGEYQLPPAFATLEVVLEGNQQENGGENQDRNIHQAGYPWKGIVSGAKPLP